MSFAQEERARLADLLEELGPDAPTMCEGWTTKDLLVHLCYRERRTVLMGISMLLDARGAKTPSGSAGPVHELVDASYAAYAARPYAELLELFRSGPGWLSPLKPFDWVANRAEMFVHHEDVRRGRGPLAPEVPEEGEWFPRVFNSSTNQALWRTLEMVSHLLVAPDSAPIHFQWRGRTGITFTTHGAAPEDAALHVTGQPGEMLLWIYGRQKVVVQLRGDESKVKLRSI